MKRSTRVHRKPTSSRRKPFSNVVHVNSDSNVIRKLLPPEAYDTIPRAQLTFTDEAVHFSRFDPRGQVVSTYPVSLEHVARAFVGVPAASGLLPPRALFWESRDNRVRIGIHLPRAPRTLHFQLKRKPEQFHLPALGFVFVGAGKAYNIFAVTDDSLRASSALYCAPLPNVNTEGNICAGNVEFPLCAPDTIERAAQLFFDSYFNHDLANNKIQHAGADLIPFLRSLSETRAKKFPIDVLIPCGTLADLIDNRALLVRSTDDADDENDETLVADGPDWDHGRYEGEEDFGMDESEEDEEQGEDE